MKNLKIKKFNYDDFKSSLIIENKEDKEIYLYNDNDLYIIDINKISLKDKDNLNNLIRLSNLNLEYHSNYYDNEDNNLNNLIKLFKSLNKYIIDIDKISKKYKFLIKYINEFNFIYNQSLDIDLDYFRYKDNLFIFDDNDKIDNII